MIHLRIVFLKKIPTVYQADQKKYLFPSHREEKKNITREAAKRIFYQKLSKSTMIFKIKQLQNIFFYLNKSFRCYFFAVKITIHTNNRCIFTIHDLIYVASFSFDINFGQVIEKKNLTWPVRRKQTFFWLALSIKTKGS